MIHSGSPLYLASGSPRRKELLGQLGVEFSTLSPDIDESVRADEAPSDYVKRMAREKGDAALDLLAQKQRADSLILSADTSVVIDGAILGKPADKADAVDMLNRLQGSTHQVFTAVSLLHGGAVTGALTVSEVDFGPMSDDEILAYWNTGEPADKAGAYGIQGLGGAFIREIRGSYTGIVGLPLYETRHLLSKGGPV